MKDALLDLLSSKKGLVYVVNALVLVGNMIGGLFGLEVDPVKLGSFVGLSAAWLVSQGIQDHGSTAAKIHADAATSAMAQPDLSAPGKSSQAGFARLAAMLVIVGIGLLALGAMVACSWGRAEEKSIVGDIVDCTKGAAPDAIKEFGPMADALLVYATGGNNVVNADAVASAAKSFGKKIGGCVLADAVTRALKPTPTGSDAPKASPLEADPESLRLAFAAALPGAHFHTANGDL